MKAEPKTIRIIQGARHQGEGFAGTSPRFHWLKRNNLIACAAVPRRLWKPFEGFVRGFLRGQYAPACPECKRQLKKRK